MLHARGSARSVVPIPAPTIRIPGTLALPFTFTVTLPFALSFSVLVLYTLTLYALLCRHALPVDPLPFCPLAFCPVPLLAYSFPFHAFPFHMFSFHRRTLPLNTFSFQRRTFPLNTIPFYRRAFPIHTLPVPPLSVLALPLPLPFRAISLMLGAHPVHVPLPLIPLVSLFTVAVAQLLLRPIAIRARAVARLRAVPGGIRPVKVGRAARTGEVLGAPGVPRRRVGV